MPRIAPRSEPAPAQAPDERDPLAGAAAARCAGGALPWEALFEQFFGADPAAAARAAGVFARLIRFWLYRLGLRESDASYEDLVQDVLLELTRSRALIQDPRSLGGWLRTTALRKVNDRWRASARRPRLGPGFGEREPADVERLLPDAQVLQKQDRADLLGAIARLAPALRDCVQMQLAGLSEAQIALELQLRGHRARGVPAVQVHHVKNWLRKARQELKRMLTENADHA